MRALITGASSGIGRKLAIELANKGYDLILIARRIERLKEIQDMFNKQDILIFQTDLLDQNQTKQLLIEINTLKIDLWINNAGFGKVGVSTSIDLQDEMDMIELNIKRLHHLTRFAIDHMTEGKIINISSMASYIPTPKLASYAASKAYVTSYSEALNYELKKQKKNIKVITVSPGPVHTEFGKVAGSNQKLKSMPVEKCVHHILKGINKNKSTIIPGFKMKLLKLFIRFFPKKLILYTAYKIQSRK